MVKRTSFVFVHNERYNAVKRESFSCKSKRYYSTNRISDTLDGIICLHFMASGLRPLRYATNPIY